MATFLFTTLPTNDLGLLTRSLPIARELAANRHTIVFCSPAPSANRLISEAVSKTSYPGTRSTISSREGKASADSCVSSPPVQCRERYGGILRVLRKLVLAMPLRGTPKERVRRDGAAPRGQAECSKYHKPRLTPQTPFPGAGLRRAKSVSKIRAFRKNGWSCRGLGDASAALGSGLCYTL